MYDAWMEHLIRAESMWWNVGIYRRSMVEPQATSRAGDLSGFEWSSEARVELAQTSAGLGLNDDGPQWHGSWRYGRVESRAHRHRPLRHTYTDRQTNPQLNNSLHRATVAPLEECCSQQQHHQHQQQKPASQFLMPELQCSLTTVWNNMQLNDSHSLAPSLIQLDHKFIVSVGFNAMDCTLECIDTIVGRIRPGPLSSTLTEQTTARTRFIHIWSWKTNYWAILLVSTSGCVICFVLCFFEQGGGWIPFKKINKSTGFI